MIWVLVAIGLYANEIYTSEKTSIANNEQYIENVEFHRAGAELEEN